MTTGRLILLGAIAALGSLAIQVIVPALPALTHGIGASPTDGQLVIATYLLVLAGGQLVWAPVADRLGRRPVILIGLGVFIAGTVLCAIAGGLAAMVLGRAVQAAGAAGSLVTARAMATDTARPGQAAAPLAVLTSITLISPAVAPVVGGLVVGSAGWRALFGLVAGMAAVAAVLAVRLLPETRVGDAHSVGVATILRRYRDVLRGNGLLPLALSNALISSGFYLFLAVSPFVLAAEGIAAAGAGLFYGLVASAIIAGTMLVPRIVARAPERLVPTGAAVLSVGAAGVILTAVVGGGVVPLLVAMAIAALGSGLTGPALLADAIERQRDHAASVVSLFGTLQMGAAALVSTAIVRLVPSTRVEIALIGALMIAAVAVRRAAR